LGLVHNHGQAFGTTNGEDTSLIEVGQAFALTHENLRMGAAWADTLPQLKTSA
jgi:hypothetical protein